MTIAHNPVQYKMTEHMKVVDHFIKEKVYEGILSVEYVPTSHQLVDLMKK